MRWSASSLLRHAALLLSLCLLVGLLVRVHGVFGLKRSLSHDESVTFLCAAATEGRYQEEIEGLLDRPVTVAEVQSFYARPGQLAFRTVAKDLVLHDTHPPLYFWILHMLHHAVGLQVWTAPLLNILLSLGMLLLLFALSRRVLGSAVPALCVAVLWYLSPAVLHIDLEGRHYPLFGLLALSSFMLSERMTASPPTLGRLAVFALVNSAGLLSHYYFAFLLIPGVLLAWKRMGLGRPLVLYLSSLVVSAAVFLLLFPEVLDFWTVLQEREPGPSRTLSDRFRTLVYASMGFLAEGHRARYLLVLVAAGLFLLGLPSLRKRGASPFVDLQAPSGFMMVQLLWAIAFTCSLYMAAIAPAQAVGEQYFVYIWPLLSLLVVQFFRHALPAGVAPWIMGLHALQLVVLAPSTVRDSPYLAHLVPPAHVEAIAAADKLVTDDWKRGVLPRLAMQLPGSLPLHLMHLELPETSGDRSIAFLHMPGEAGDHPWTAVLQAEGWQVEQHDLKQHTLVLARR